MLEALSLWVSTIKGFSMLNHKYSEILLTDEVMPFFKRLEIFAENNGVTTVAILRDSHDSVDCTH